MFVTAVKPVLTRLLCFGSQAQYAFWGQWFWSLPSGGSHPDRSRFSGEGKDLARRPV